MSNIIDEEENYDNPIKFLNDRKWYASDSLDCYEEPSNLKKLNRDNVTPEAIAVVYDILVNGNRTTDNNEHDSFSDIIKIECNGEIYTDEHPEDISNRDLYIKGETIIYNKYGAIFRFDTFPTDDPACDPFGKKIGEWKE